MGKITFTSWLLDQTDRDDPIGDLANDAKRDAGWPRDATARAAFESHIRRSGSDTSGAVRALHEAWREYSGR